LADKSKTADRKLLSVIPDTVDAASLETETPSAPVATAHTQERDNIEHSGLNSPGSPEPLSAQIHPHLHEKLPPADMMAGHNSMVPDSFYESFRCLEETSNLDLQLRLDNYPTSNTRPNSPPQKQRNPSFRRHLSISKVHLGLSSQPSSSRPGTKDTSATSTTSPPPSIASFGMPMSPTHGRRRSRALSLRSPGPSIAENVSGPIPVPVPVPSGLDSTAAAHYQDPEARLKLRVYLASPQKFDEAVEFGFPSTELRPGRRAPEVRPLRKQQSCFVLSDDTDKVHTFLSDDKSSVYSDDVSMAEPDSPKTPEPLEKPPATRSYRAASDAGLVAKVASDYNQAAASAREMTLRMTLTRPDLRAGEEQIYGWQQKHVTSGGRKSQSSALREELSPTVVYIREGNSKDSIERQFAAFDQWAPPERGVVKRFWNRVRRQ